MSRVQSISGFPTAFMSREWKMRKGSVQSNSQFPQPLVDDKELPVNLHVHCTAEHIETVKRVNTTFWQQGRRAAVTLCRRRHDRSTMAMCCQGRRKGGSSSKWCEEERSLNKSHR